MSSTTDVRKRGQILVLFGLTLTVVFFIAALAFDTGSMLLERRDQQNAADAAALAGARYLHEGPQDPVAAARAVATANGFTAGGSTTVAVNIPPTSGSFRSFAAIEVVISTNRPSIFGGIMGVFGWDVAARAVAANEPGRDLPFSMLALNETACEALKVSGSGTVESAGTIQVNSDCATALSTSGTGTLRVTADGATCNAVGGIFESKGPGSELDCVRVPDSYMIEDPLRGLPAPDVPPAPSPIQQVGGTTRKPAAACPGGDPTDATAAAPASCRFGGAYDGRTYRLFAGYYPGGLDFGKGTYYLEPGIYYVGGGGFRAAGGVVLSVAPGGTTLGGGVLIYNTEAPLFHDQCATVPPTAPDPPTQCIAAVVLNGADAAVNLLPLNDGSQWDGMVVYQDRNLNVAGTDVQINGGGSAMEVAGTIYVPSGHVQTNGSTGTLTLDQVIADTFTINGSGGNIKVLYRSGVTARIAGVGLVE